MAILGRAQSLSTHNLSCCSSGFDVLGPTVADCSIECSTAVLDWRTFELSRRFLYELLTSKKDAGSVGALQSFSRLRLACMFPLKFPRLLIGTCTSPAMEVSTGRRGPQVAETVGCKRDDFPMLHSHIFRPYLLAKHCHNAGH